jgi:hypothetical protein
MRWTASRSVRSHNENAGARECGECRDAPHVNVRAPHGTDCSRSAAGARPAETSLHRARCPGQHRQKYAPANLEHPHYAPDRIGSDRTASSSKCSMDSSRPQRELLQDGSALRMRTRGPNVCATGTSSSSTDAGGYSQMERVSRRTYDPHYTARNRIESRPILSTSVVHRTHWKAANKNRWKRTYGVQVVQCPSPALARASMRGYSTRPGQHGHRSIDRPCPAPTCARTIQVKDVYVNRSSAVVAPDGSTITTFDDIMQVRLFMVLLLWCR